MNKSTEFSKSSFFKYVFKHWIKILSISLVCFIVASVGAYCWLESTKGNRQKNIEEAIEEYNEEYNVYYVNKLSLENELELLYQDMDSVKEYFDESVYMKMDSWYAQAYSCDYSFVQSESVKGESTLDRRELIENINDGIVDNLIGIGSILSIEDAYAMELVTLNYDVASEIYSVKVIYPDEAKAEEITDYIYKVICRMKDKYDRDSEYTVSKSDLVSTPILDDEVANKKVSRISKYKDLNKKAEAKKIEIDKLIEPKVPSVKSISRKYEAILSVALGLVAFMLIWGIYMGICYLIMIKKGIMMTANDFWKASGYFPIAKFAATPEDSEYDRLFTILKIALEDEKNIMFVGDIDADRMDELVEKAKKKLSENSITYGFDVKKDTKALKLLADADVVVPVMQREYTTKKSVLDQTKAINDFDKKVIGCAVF